MSDSSSHLSGPFSPFQVSFISVISKLTTVIRRDSINSCMLDTSFGFTPRHLVACFLSKSHRSTNTIAQETTALPPIPLLAPILSLIFVPSNDVIFRANRNHNKYLGVLIGKKLEYDFDSILSIEDINDINELRKLMNESLESIDKIKKPNTYPLRRLLFSILTRERLPLKVRPAPNSFVWKSLDGNLLSYSETTKNYQSIKSDKDDLFKKQNDFLPLESIPDIFPKILGINPPLIEGFDYDSEEELRQEMVNRIDDFERSVYDDQSDDITREEPEVVCQQCKALISEISDLKTISNPFTNGIAWRLTNSFGKVYSTDIEDDLYTRKLRKPVTRIACRDNHFIGWNVDGMKIISPDSEVEIHGINNEVILWKPSAWANSFAMFQKDINEKKTKQKSSYNDRLIEHKEYTCPCCNITVYNKKEIFLHLNSKKHKQEKEETLRKTKYARHALKRF